jgi:hypothetical protein
MDFYYLVRDINESRKGENIIEGTLPQSKLRTLILSRPSVLRLLLVSEDLEFGSANIRK